jgi:hypothetical protein
MGVLAAALLSTGFALAGDGPLYPDFDVRYVSGSHVTVKYYPRLSEDLRTLGHGDLLPIAGGRGWGRSFLVAVPLTGEVDFTIDYVLAGYAPVSDTAAYVSSSTPLVTLAGFVEDRKSTRLNSSH